MRLRAALLTASCSLLLAACGGGDEEETASTTTSAPPASTPTASTPAEAPAGATGATGPAGEVKPADADPGNAAIVTEAVTRLEDLPEGWAVKPDDDQPENDACPGVTQARKTVAARLAADFEKEGSDFLTAAYVYDEDAEAETAFADLVAEDTQACLSREFLKVLKAQDGIRTQKPAVGDSEAVELGDEGTRYTLSFPFEAGGQEAELRFEVTTVRTGRGISIVSAVTPDGSVSPEIVDEVAGPGVERMAGALGG